ncbi:MAG: VOC family protein [Bacteroidetes bacterium]|nr:VOC family protein [Bacteroidota bacterium]
MSYSTCLWFDGRAEEAAHFYAKLFPDVQINNISKMPDGSVMSVDFTMLDQHFIALNGNRDQPFTDAISFVVNCASQEEIDRYWNAFKDNGGVELRCGWIRDPFGITWQILPADLWKYLSVADPEKSQKVRSAFFAMKKIVINELAIAIK